MRAAYSRDLITQGKKREKWGDTSVRQRDLEDVQFRGNKDAVSGKSG